MTRPIVLVPGGMNPAAITYADVLGHVSYEVDPLLKDHELYRGDAPPAGWTLDTEVDAILRAADARGFRSFDLVGYSGGGGVALLLVERHPERVRSLALVEPAWIGEHGPLGRDAMAAFVRAFTLPPDQAMPAFMRIEVKPDVELPPRAPGPAPSWMRKRPAGFAAFVREFSTRTLDHGKLREFAGPAYVAYGDRSAGFHEERARTLGATLRHATVEAYAGAHHFDPPHRKEPERFADALRKLWAAT